MSYRKNSTRKLNSENINNNIEDKTINCINKKNFSFNKFNNLQNKNIDDENFVEESIFSNNNKKYFNQIKLINDNKNYDSNFNHESKFEKNLNRKIDNIKSYLPEFINKETVIFSKNNKCFDLNQVVLKNIYRIKEKLNNDNMINNLIPMKNYQQDNNNNVEDKYLITNEHIINNCNHKEFKNGNLTKNILCSNKLLINSQAEKNFIIKENNFEENYPLLKNANKNEIYNKDIIKNETLKLRKNFSAVLKNKKDLYKYLENNDRQIISSNFEKEKNRINRKFIFSANPNRITIKNKSQNSSLDKNSSIKVESCVKITENCIQSIQQENKLIPRKYKSANYLEKRKNNFGSFKSNDQAISKKSNNEDKILINKNNKIIPINNQHKKILFLTNLNNKNNNNEKNSIEKKNIFTPYDYERYFSNNFEKHIYPKFPPRNILKVKSDNSFIKKNKSCDLKNSDVYYKNKKKINVFHKIKDFNIPLKNKNLSRNLEKIDINMKYELTTLDFQDDMSSNKDNFDKYFAINNNNENLKYNDLDFKILKKQENIENLFGEKKMNKNENNNSCKFIQYEKDQVISEEIKNDKNNLGNSIYIDKKDDFDPIEKELNFSRISSENRAELKKDNKLKIKSSKKIYTYFSTRNSCENENKEYRCLNENKIDKKSQIYLNKEINATYSKNKINNKKKTIFQNTINNNVFLYNRTSNFFSKNKIFSFNNENNSKLENKNNNFNFVESLNVNKIKFVFKKDNNQEKIPLTHLENKVAN